jgi:hypothetical protein
MRLLEAFAHFPPHQAKMARACERMSVQVRILRISGVIDIIHRQRLIGLYF